ncbi:MAG: hypothetical protein WC526_01465 [Patescibacteria group bacterium]
MDKKLLGRSFIHALLAFAYIFCIGLFFNHAEQIFPREPDILIPVVMLLLFVLSAAIMGILIFGKPVMMYLDNQKKDALKLLGYTVGWIAFFLLAVIIFVFLF